MVCFCTLRPNWSANCGDDQVAFDVVNIVHLFDELKWYSKPVCVGVKPCLLNEQTTEKGFDSLVSIILYSCAAQISDAVLVAQQHGALTRRIVSVKSAILQ